VVGAVLHRALHGVFEPAVEVFAYAGASSLEDQARVLRGRWIIALLWIASFCVSP
jgi:hypothetical protein